MPKRSRRRLEGFVPTDTAALLQSVSPGLSLQPLGSWPLEIVSSRSQRYHRYDGVRAELGIPRGAILYLGILHAPFQWEEYSFEVVGTPREPTTPPAAPQFTPLVYPELQAAIVAWSRRAVYQPTQEWVEVRWHPAQGETTLVHREASTRSLLAAREADDALYRGLELLHTTLGRPAATGTYRHREEFLDVLVPLVKHAKAHGINPSQQNIAERWNSRIKTRQLQRWFSAYVKVYTGEGWQGFVDRV